MSQAVSSLTSAYRPSYDTTGLVFKCATGAAAARLTDMLGVAVPTHPDDSDIGPGSGPRTVLYRHMIIKADPANTGPIYWSADNNTAPVVGGPGIPLAAGEALKFENCQELLRPRASGPYPVNAKTAFQFISAAAQVLHVHFFD